MKLFILGLLALNLVFATTFSFNLDENIISTQTSGDVELMQTVEVEVMQVLQKSALIKVDGEVKEY